MLVGELDKDVFEAGSEGPNFGDGNAVFQELLTEIVEVEVVVDECVNGLTENGGAADARKPARGAARRETIMCGRHGGRHAPRCGAERRIPRNWR